MADSVYVVGVGAEGRQTLTPRAKEIVDQAAVLVGGERLLAMFPDSKAERLVLRSDLGATVDRIKGELAGRRIVVLASGDPGFFGIGELLVKRLGKERVEIVPNVSSVQLAFARIKERWDDAVLLSVHGRQLEGLAAQVRSRAKVAILGDGANSPAAIARTLLAAGISDYQAFVCENLGTAEERVRCLDLVALVDDASPALSVLILIRKDCPAGDAVEDDCGERHPAAGGPWRQGIPDEEFFQRRPRRGLITKAEVRVVSIARLGLSERSVVWDVGAGCGSVAIEAALVARQGQVYAVERNVEDVALIRQNVAKFGTDNVVVIHATAPEGLEALPAPDAVFVGGSGGALAAILDLASRRLCGHGRVVINAATLETAVAAGRGLRERGFAVETTLMQVSRSKDLGSLTHFEALDPVFIVAGRRDHHDRSVNLDEA